MITDYQIYFDPSQAQLAFDGSTPALVNGTPITGYVSVLAEVRGLDLAIELLIVIVILLAFIFYELLVISRRLSK